MATQLYTLDAQSTLPNYTLQTDLDGSTYSFTFQWNERVGAWFMSIADSDGNALVSGVRIVVGFPLANRTTNDALFPGMLFATDTTGQSDDPGLLDLGGRVLLQYLAVGSDA